MLSRHLLKLVMLLWACLLGLLLSVSCEDGRDEEVEFSPPAPEFPGIDPDLVQSALSNAPDSASSVSFSPPGSFSPTAGTLGQEFNQYNYIRPDSQAPDPSQFNPISNSPPASEYSTVEEFGSSSSPSREPYYKPAIDNPYYAPAPNNAPYSPPSPNNAPYAPPAPDNAPYSPPAPNNSPYAPPAPENAYSPPAPESSETYNPENLSAPPPPPAHNIIEIPESAVIPISGTETSEASPAPAPSPSHFKAPHSPPSPPAPHEEYGPPGYSPPPVVESYSGSEEHSHLEDAVYLLNRRNLDSGIPLDTGKYRLNYYFPGGSKVGDIGSQGVNERFILLRYPKGPITPVEDVSNANDFIASQL